jgi:hypothetical protein
MGCLVACLTAVALLGAQVEQPLKSRDTDPVASNGHARLLEAFAAPSFRKSTPSAIVAISAKQRDDVSFGPLAERLSARLRARGFNIVDKGGKFTTAITLEYGAYRDTDARPGDRPPSPGVLVSRGSGMFSAYRRLTVAAYDISDRSSPALLWRTVLDEDGFDLDVTRTISSLVDAGAPSYGLGRTALAKAECSDSASPIGSHIPDAPCRPAAERLSRPVIQRRPQVTIGPLSFPKP